MTALDSQAQRIAGLSEHQTFPGPSRVAQAKSRFEQRALEWELEAQPAAERFTVLPAAGIWPAAAAVAVCICLLGFSVWWLGWNPDPSPDEVLAATWRWEQGFCEPKAPVHQVLRVEIEGSSPQSKTRVSRLETWTEPVTGRFKLQWRDAGGELRHGIWRPEAGRDLVYYPVAEPAVAPRATGPRTAAPFAEFTRLELDSNQIENAFMKWLESRTYRPISLSRDLAVLAAEDGMVVRAERVRSALFGPVIRLSAHKAGEGRRVEAVLEVDPETYQPRLHRIRFFAGERTLEFRVAVERAEFMPPNRLRRIVFEPDLPLRSEARIPPPKPRVLGIERVTPPAGISPPALSPSAADLDAAEVDALFHLHGIRACLGEPVEILRQAERIEIRGLARDERRLEELLAALAGLRETGLATVNIQTVDDAVRATALPPGPAQEAADSIRSSSGRLPIEERLERHFRETSLPGLPPAAIRREVAEFIRLATAQSEAMLDEAWALRRVTERFPIRRIQGLPPGARAVLEAITRDHVAELRAKADVLHGLANPVLVSVAGGAPPQVPLPGLVPAGPNYWTDEALALFDSVERTNDLVNAVFASDGPAPAGATQPEEDLAGLLARISRLKNQTEAFDKRFAAAFRESLELHTVKAQPEAPAPGLTR